MIEYLRDNNNNNNKDINIKDKDIKISATGFTITSKNELSINLYDKLVDVHRPSLDDW